MKSQVHAATKPATEADAIQATQPDVLAGGRKPQWIWGGDDDASYYLSKRFYLAGKVKKSLSEAALVATCDSRLAIMINGKSVAEGRSWKAPVRRDVSEHLKLGFNEILVHGRNDDGGPAGFAMKLALRVPGKKTQYIVSDKSWQVSTEIDSGDRQGARTLGEMGVEPWRNVFLASHSRSRSGNGTRGVFRAPAGFQIERLYTVPQAHGSWAAITFDDKGRLIVSDGVASDGVAGEQKLGGLYHILPAPIGDKHAESKVEPLHYAITSAGNERDRTTSVQDVAYAFDSLYVLVNSTLGSVLYRARDTNGDDTYDHVTKLRSFSRDGEHGPLGMRLLTDNGALFVCAGTDIESLGGFEASQISGSRPGSPVAGGGWIAKTDPDGKSWQLLSVGLHSPGAIGVNADGELFACDADAKSDQGMPWYRDARVLHVTRSSDFGWRSGVSSLPPHYVDSLPALQEFGAGALAGNVFGYGANFPARYQRAMFVLDGARGAIDVLDIEPDGASYKATKEAFLARTPLPLVDAEIGPDGALYFIIGSHGAPSELFRVTYVGKKSTAPVNAVNTEFADMRVMRRQLEAYHRPMENASAAIELATENLGHADRHIRYAARVALEHQPRELWETRVLSRNDPQAIIVGVVALSRKGGKKDGPKLLAALDHLEFATLSESLRLDLLRAYALIFMRQGRPDQKAMVQIVGKLDSIFPAKSDRLNRELSRLLVYLESPTVISKALTLMKEVPATAQGMHFAHALSSMRNGWTLEQRRAFFNWLGDAAGRGGAASRQVALENIRAAAVATLSEAERNSLALLLAPAINKESLPQPKGPGQDWSLAMVESLTKGGLSGRDFENGRRTFAAARCIVCHRFDGRGGSTGPALTDVIGRFSYHDLAEAIVDPSRDIPDQYRGSSVETIDGIVIVGRVLRTTDGNVVVLTDSEDANKVVPIPQHEIDSITPLPTSFMPNGLLKPLNRDEVLDLLAYLMSRGNPANPVFEK